MANSLADFVSSHLGGAWVFEDPKGTGKSSEEREQGTADHVDAMNTTNEAENVAENPDTTAPTKAEQGTADNAGAIAEQQDPQNIVRDTEKGETRVTAAKDEGAKTKAPISTAKAPALSAEATKLLSIPSAVDQAANTPTQHTIKQRARQRNRRKLAKQAKYVDTAEPKACRSPSISSMTSSEPPVVKLPPVSVGATTPATQNMLASGIGLEEPSLVEASTAPTCDHLFPFENGYHIYIWGVMNLLRS